MVRLLNIVLLIATLVGAVLFLFRQSELAPIRNEHQRLANKVGVLEVENPGRYKIIRVDTGDPTHFLWRVYFPKNAYYKMACKGFSGTGSSSSSRSDSGEALLRLRFEFSGDTMVTHRMLGGSGGRSSTSDQDLVQFFQDHWQDLDIELAEEHEFGEDNVIDLVKLKLSDKIRDQLGATKSRSLKRLLKRKSPILHLEFGSVKGFELAKQKDAELPLGGVSK